MSKQSNRMGSERVVSDYEADTIYLVHPSVNASEYDTHALAPIYNRIIDVLKEHVKIKLVSIHPISIPGVENIVIKGVKDIWVRDFGVIQVGNEFYVPDYHPDYLNRPGDEPFLNSAPAFRKARFPNAKRLPLVLDLGNFVTNGQVAIITDMVLKQNPGMKEEDLKRRLKPLDLEQIYLIPKEPYDWTGHADGMFCFLDTETLLMSDYGETGYSMTYRKGLHRHIRQLEKQFNLVPVPSFLDEDPKNPLSAVGIYVNLLNLHDVLLLPKFNHPNDDLVYGVVLSVTKKPIVRIEAPNLAKCGGIFHCMTCTTIQ